MKLTMKLTMNMWWSSVERPYFAPQDLFDNWDVAIVGGGFSGLWTAHHLLLNDPSLKIAILEKDRIGSGASGRNGGWVSALYPQSDRVLSKNFSQEQISALHRSLASAIDEIGEFAASHTIVGGFHKGGTLTIARNRAQLGRINNEPGFLNQSQTLEKISLHGALGSLYSPDCAVINPATLVVALGRSLEERGVAIFEGCHGDISTNGTISVGGKNLAAKFTVRAIEAYLEQTRTQVPIYSLIVATHPLRSATLDSIGLANRESFAEASHLITYAQRTSDNRLVIGGRGAPYSWGSRRNDAREVGARAHSHLRRRARQWFPALDDHSFSHAWGGAVGVTRDWSPYVRVRHNYAELGGYVGDGVTLSYLAAGALADALLGKTSARTSLPFVQWKSRNWEREPFRWMAINAAMGLTSLADYEERRTHRSSLLMKSLSPLVNR